MQLSLTLIKKYLKYLKFGYGFMSKSSIMLNGELKHKVLIEMMIKSNLVMLFCPSHQFSVMLYGEL